jgi:geranylgeranyl transferase type-1 subunit beta
MNNIHYVHKLIIDLGGTTYCAIAALYLMGELNLNDPRLRRTKRWSILRLSSGFQGRVNKPVDTCYSFWLGSSLKVSH